MINQKPFEKFVFRVFIILIGIIGTSLIFSPPESVWFEYSKKLFTTITLWWIVFLFWLSKK